MTAAAATVPPAKFVVAMAGRSARYLLREGPFKFARLSAAPVPHGQVSRGAADPQDEGDQLRLRARTQPTCERAQLW